MATLCTSRSLASPVDALGPTNAALVAAVAAVGLGFGWDHVVLAWLPCLVLATPLSAWLFFVQHKFPEAYWRQAAEWRYAESALKGASYYALPRWLAWLTANIGEDDIHHLFPSIPSYRLPVPFGAVER